MSQAVDRFCHVQFQGVKAGFSGSIATRRIRPLREVPFTSSFDRDQRPHATVSPPDRLLLDVIFERASLNTSAYRPGALARRIPACLRALQARSPADAIRRLEHDPDALDLALNALLIGVTTFFRDPLSFEHLRTVALPDLLQTSTSPRMLSVGCSDGAELYSLALCLLDLGVRDFDLRGIDFRRPAVRAARTGLYSHSALAAVPPHLRHAWFDLRARAAQVKPALRQRLHFQHADAFHQVLHGPYDLVACRNFSIYLEHPAAARLWRKLHNALRPGGLLLAGKAENPTGGFLRAGPCLFRKASP
jgi:chemotaxis methyl-accepting protein methylase